ncbi:hypothetical protein PMAYCL1PPCAC_22308, partial [Pristionchus mayeri]
RKTCTMHLKADHSLYRHILSKEGKNDPIRTREEIISIFYTHMKAANEIYENTKFKDVDGITFSVKQISV